MTDNYDIYIGGDKTSYENGDDVVKITEFESLEFNRNKSAMSDCTVTVKQNITLEQYVLDGLTVYNENANEYVFRGTLETISSSSDSVMTTLKGRGPLLSDKQETATYTAESMWGENALDDFVFTHSHSLTSADGTGVTRDKGGPSPNGTVYEGSELIGNTDGVDRSSNEKYLKPIAFWAEDDNTFTGTYTAISDENLTLDYSGGEAARINASDNWVYNEFTPEHDVGTNYKLWARLSIPEGETNTLDVSVDGSIIGSLSIDNTSGETKHEWIEHR